MKYKPTLDSEWVEWPYWRGPTREDCAEVESGMPLFWSLDEFGTKERIYALKWADGSEWHSGLGFGYESAAVDNNPQYVSIGWQSRRSFMYAHYEAMESRELSAHHASTGYYIIYSDKGGPIARTPIRYIDGKWHQFPIEPIPSSEEEEK